MIWGKTYKQKDKKKSKVGDTKLVFAWFPMRLKDGRHVWWDHVLCTLRASFTGGGRYWSCTKVVKKGIGEWYDLG